MRITEDRYSHHRRSLDLAWRLIKHEARTRTISRWTQLSGHRIRQLYKSYSSKQHKRVTRHRGMSPYKLEMIMSSPRLRCEGAMFAAICRSLEVLPDDRLGDPERTLPGVERGELLCEAFEWFCFDAPDTKLTLEHGLLVINELARGELVRLGACRTCRGVILLDRLSTGRLDCVFCSTKLDNVEGMSIVHAQAQFSRNSGESRGHNPERCFGERRRGQQAHVNSTEATPHQLSCFDECQDLGVANGGNVRQLGQGAEHYRVSSEVPARRLPDDEGKSPNLTLFEEFDDGRITTA
jgi:hypothetical protein